jgi:hypothetical protein
MNPRGSVVSLLLRKPHGFEGLGPVVVDRSPYELSVAHGPYGGWSRLDFDPTSLAARAYLDMHENAILPDPDEVPRLHVHVFPRRQKVLEHPPNGFATVIDSGVGADRSREVVFEIRMDMLEGSVQAIAVECLKGSTHDLHVLLRHRPRSIPLPEPIEGGTNHHKQLVSGKAAPAATKNLVNFELEKNQAF